MNQKRVESDKPLLHKTGRGEGNRRELIAFLEAITEPGTAIELRALDPIQKKNDSQIFSRERLSELADCALDWSGKYQGVYFTLNPLHLPLSCAEGGNFASKKDILRRRWLFIDSDSLRPTGVSATDEEKAESWRLIERVRAGLRIKGWPEPILCDSGNGFHLLYRIDLPVEDSGLVKGVLHALGGAFNTPGAEIDPKVHNPARICRLPYTWACKGPNTLERPHRLACVLEMPDELRIVSKEQLEQLAGPVSDSKGSFEPISEEGSECWCVPPDLLPRAIQAARSYLKLRNPAIDGKGGDLHTWKTIVILERGYALPFEEGFPLLLEWNEMCRPPWHEGELERKWDHAVASAGEYIERRGDKLPPAIQAEMRKRLA